MKKLLLLLVPLCLCVGAFAQQLTLNDAIAIALKNNFGIQIARNGVAIAQANNNYGVAGGLPLVNITGTDQEQLTSIRQKYSTPSNDKSSDNNSSNQLGVGLNASELLFNGGRVVNAKKRLNVTEAQSKQVLSSRQLLVVYNVMLKYFDIIRQQSYAKTLEQSIEASKQRLEIVQAQKNVGLANDADLFQSEVDLNTQKQNLQAQQLVVSQGKTDLLTLLTVNPDSAITIQDTIIVDQQVQLDSILNRLSSNPDLIAADQQVLINQYIVNETAALRYPSVSVSGIYTFNRTQNSVGFSLLNENYGPYIGLNLTVPIFNGGIYRSQQKVAEINVKNAALLKDTLALNYKSNVIKNWQAYQNNLGQLQTAAQNYTLSGKLLNLILEKFRLHQATIVDVKNAQQSFENAGYTLINVCYAAKIAEVQLKRYANTLIL